MASFIDTVKTVFSEKHFAPKMVLTSIIAAYPLYQIAKHFEGWLSPWSIASIFAVIFFLGYVYNSAGNVIQEKDIVLPGFFNPFKIFFIGCGGVIATGPMVALMIYVGYCLWAILSVKFPFATALIGVLVSELLLLGILAVQLTLYCSKYNPLDSYRLVKIFSAFAEFTMKSIGLLIMTILFSAIILLPLGYLVHLIFGTGGIFFFALVFCTLTILMLLTQYYSQLYMESIVLVRKLEYDDAAGDITDKDIEEEF